ncbi:MAG: hypothetical protein BWK79_18255 [Beggiatoa sp. IS2]|nr:MAG: hypothetical protein BWK79_18255 [Beggiatoa sp. IS2]
MTKKFFKQWLPHAEIKNHPRLQCFGTLLNDPNLWHLNRHSLSGGMAVGLFCAFVPIPMQMLLAAGVAILFRVNLPLSVALVWLTNPVTMPPVFYFAYKLGAYLLSIKPQPITFDITVEWFFNTLGNIWQPFLLGCFVLGTISALLGYLTVQMLWRLQVGWQHRREQRLKKLLTLKRKQLDKVDVV